MIKSIPPGVQTAFTPFNCRSMYGLGALHAPNATRYREHATYRGVKETGRIGEVPVPASRHSFFTAPLFALRAQRVSCPAGQAAAAATGAVDD